jgi:hypothetical protein
MGAENLLSDDQVKRIDTAIESSRRVEAENAIEHLRERIDACSSGVWQFLNWFVKDGGESVHSLSDDAKSGLLAAKRAVIACREASDVASVLNRRPDKLIVDAAYASTIILSDNFEAGVGSDVRALFTALMNATAAFASEEAQKEAAIITGALMNKEKLAAAKEHAQKLKVS